MCVADQCGLSYSILIRIFPDYRTSTQTISSNIPSVGKGSLIMEDCSLRLFCTTYLASAK